MGDLGGLPTINDDGAISAKHHPHLVLGMKK